MFISAAQLRELLEKGAQLIDVRSPAEYSRGAAPGAKNIPVQALPHQAAELDKDKPVVVYCMTGGRSAQAQMILRSMGFAEVHNAGGINNVLSA